MTPSNPKYRMLYFIWAVLETFGFAGLLEGWGSLVYILKDEGLFMELCELNATSNISFYPDKDYNTDSSRDNATEVGTLLQSCPARDKMLSLVFTVVSTLYNVGIGVMGQINYKFKTRKSRLLAFGMFISGTLMVAITSTEMPWLLFPGLFLMANGGFVSFMTNIQFAVLFPKHRFFIIGVINGAVDSSAGVQQLMKISYDYGISRQISYFTLQGVYVLTLVNTFFFLPKGFIYKPSENHNSTVSHGRDVREYDNMTLEKLDDKEVDTCKTSYSASVSSTPPISNISENNNSSDISTHESVDLNGGNVVKFDNLAFEKDVDNGDSTCKESVEASPPEQASKPSLKECIKSQVYISHLIWWSILRLRFYYFLNTLNTFLELVLDNDKAEVSHYTGVSTYILMTGLLMCIFVGWFCDICTKCISKNKSVLHYNIMSTVVPQIITTTLCLVISGLLLVEDKAILYAVFALFTLYRAFLNTVGTGFISAVYPTEYFGTLVGIMMLVSGVVGTLQYGLYYWAAETGSFYQVNMFLNVITLLTYLHPLVLMWTVRRPTEKKPAAYQK